MAIINNNVTNVKFLRNGAILASRDLARQALEQNKTLGADGTALLARYSGENPTDVKTLVGFVWSDGTNYTITIIDVEGGSADVERLREEINAKLGDGVSSANTVTDQLEQLSGSTASTSADTSVEGAKKYAYDLLGTLDYTDTAETGSYVSKVDQVDGKISTTKVALPTVSGEVESKKVVMSVSEDKGQIAVEKGTIDSSDKTVVISDAVEGNGIDFKVNIDNETLIADTGTGVISVASAALTQYVGDEDTVHISAVDSTTNTKTISSPLTISATTPSPSDTNVKEQYNLVGASGNTIGATIKIYKDSSVAEIYVGTNYDSVNTTTGVVDKKQIGDVVDEHTIVAEDFQYLNYVYEKSDGTYEMTKINLTSFLIEPEFKSGVTISNGVAVGVVDPTSEKDGENNPFLTVGAGGFKVDGIKDEIISQLATVVADLDAVESGSSTHVSVEVAEENGKITAVTVDESNIANANDLTELSGKTVTALTSTNSSITASINDAAGCKTYDIETDASKIKLSGYTAIAGGLTAITEDTSVTDAIEALEAEIVANEGAVDDAIEDLDGRLDVVEEKYLSGVSVNGADLTVASHVAQVSIEAATSSMSGATSSAIVVETDASGNITLGLNYIDCGTY